MTDLQAPQFSAPSPVTKKKHRKWPWIILAVFVVIGIFAVSNGNKGSTTTPAAPATSAAPETSAASGIGTAVRDSRFEFTIQTVTPGVAGLQRNGQQIRPQGEFTLVNVKITNIGNQPQTFFGTNTKADDSTGRQYAMNLLAAAYLPNSDSLFGPINPGDSVVGTLVFDVHVGSTLALIELHDNAFGGEVTVQL